MSGETDSAGRGTGPETAGEELRLNAGAFEHDTAARPKTRTAQNYRLAAILFMGGGLGAILPDALYQPAHPPTIYLLPALALVTGCLVWLAAGRLRRRWLHLVAIVATLEVTLTVALADEVFAIYFTFIAIFVAYVFESRRVIAAHVAFACAAAFAPVLIDSDNARENLIQWLTLTPTLLIAAATVAFLRERLAESEDRFRVLSERDPLTGVGNYRMLSLAVPRELKRHTRVNRPLGLIVIDLDDFKRVNDSYGHQRGDAILQEVGRVLGAAVREHDIVVRQGGDEFAIVAPESGPDQAGELAERLCDAVGAISADGTPIGASCGIACFPADAKTLEGLLAAADARLRGAKASRPTAAYRTPVPTESE